MLRSDDPHSKSSKAYELTLPEPDEHSTEPEGGPAIPSRVFDLLPPRLREGCELFARWYERDVFLTALLGTLSAAMPHIRFLYGNTPHSLHLMLFVLAEAASGKGVMSHAFHWLEGVDDQLATFETGRSGSVSMWSTIISITR